MTVVRGEVATGRGAACRDELTTVLGWADEIRAGRLGVRANADNADDAARAREWGAEGIGLCRTEHQFLGDRLPLVRRMILAETDEDEAAALEELGAQQRVDFEALLEAMDGLPVTVRLLDPPLHEFLPDLDELIAGEARGELDAEEARLLARRPGAGGSRTRCSASAGCASRCSGRASTGRRCGPCSTRPRPGPQAGGTPIVEVMIPLVVVREELALARSWVEEELGRTRRRHRHRARRDHDRDAPGLRAGPRDRRGGRLLLVRHQRPDPADVRLQPGRRRGPADDRLPRAGPAGGRPVQHGRPGWAWPT